MADTLYVDDFTGIKRDFIHLDDGTFALQATQDVQPILDANKAEHLHGDGYSPSRDLKHVARIPVIVAEQWLNLYGVDVLDPAHKERVRKLLNDRDWMHLRTSGGKL